MKEVSLVTLDHFTFLNLNFLPEPIKFMTYIEWCQRACVCNESHLHTASAEAVRCKLCTTFDLHTAKLYNLHTLPHFHFVPHPLSLNDVMFSCDLLSHSHSSLKSKVVQSYQTYLLRAAIKDGNAPINIRPHYSLDGQRWGLIGDLTAFDLKIKNRPEGWGI